jgi:hypothetical protein
MTGTIDPTYPPQLKPLLYAYDEYQTYDLVYAEYPTGGPPYIWGLDDLLGLGAMKACLFERFTPWEYPWSEVWSTRYKDFLNPFLNSAHSKITETLTYPFAAQYAVKESIDLNIPKGTDKQVIITWMEKDIEDSGGFWLADCAFIKRYRIIDLCDDTQQITIILGPILKCSVVISGDSNAVSAIEGQFNSKSLGYLYKNLDGLFQKISNIIDKADPDRTKINVPVSYSLACNINYSAGWLTPDQIIYDQDGHPTWINWGSLEFAANPTNTQYEHLQLSDIGLPGWYKGLAIFYANNNHWQNGNAKRADYCSAGPYFAVVPGGTNNDQVRAGLLREGNSYDENVPIGSSGGDTFPPGGMNVYALDTPAHISFSYSNPAFLKNVIWFDITLQITVLSNSPYMPPNKNTPASISFMTCGLEQKVSWDGGTSKTKTVKLSPGSIEAVTPYVYWLNKQNGTVKQLLNDFTGANITDWVTISPGISNYVPTKWDVVPALSGSASASDSVIYDFYSGPDQVPQPHEIPANAFQAICYAYYQALAL